MEITRESDNPTEVTLTISMDAADEEPFLNRSYRRVVSRLQIPGFRPGKAPRSVVERHVGRIALVQEALEFMIPESLDKVLKDHDISAFVEPELEVLDLEPVSFKAVVALEPEVELGEIGAIVVERTPVDISQEDVGRVLEELRYESAPWEPADRPVAFGDLLTVNVKGSIVGEQVIDDDGVDFIPQQDNQLPVPGFSIYLEGMTEGQEKEFTLTVPDDFAQENYAGQDCRFNVEVLSIKEKQLPELDDEFAKGVREGYESLDALNEDIRQRLTDNGETVAQRQLEQSSLEELTNQSTIRASDLIYQRELEAMYQDRERALRNQRLDMDTYLGMLGQTEQEWRDQYRPQAEERLKTSLVIRKLAEQEGLDVEAEEVEAEIEQLLGTSSADSEAAMRMALSTENAKDSIRVSLLNRKVMGRLVELVEAGASELSEAGPVEQPAEQPVEDPAAPGPPEGPAVDASASETDEAGPDNSETPATEEEATN